MALPTLPGDEKQEDKLNPGQQHYDQAFNDIARAEEKGSFDDIVNNNYSKDEINKLSEQESEGTKEASGGIRSTYTGSKNSSKTRFQKVKMFAKKRGGIVAILAVLGIGGGSLAGFFGPASMLINLAENATLKNDSSSTALERRFTRVFGFAITDDPICAGNTKNIKCKMGRISNSALDKLSKKGVTPVFADEVDNADRKKTGYPSKNPIAYEVDFNDGKGIQRINTSDFMARISENPKLANKVLGRGGAFNARVNAWTGKHITQKLYSKFNLKRDGGLADGSSKRMSAKERLADATKRMQEKIPGNEKISGVSENVKTKITERLGFAKKGGSVYVGAVAGCVAVKVPSIIASSVAAVQLAQAMPVGMDLILSPAGKSKNSGVDIANSVSAEDIDSIGTLLTNKTPREGDGKMTSALDSPILQSAVGVNKNKPAVATDVTPGYSVLTSDLVKAAGEADKASEPACNAIMSPAAMYTAMAVNGAVTIALSSTVIGGIIKVIADNGTAFLISQAASKAAGALAQDAVTVLAKNDKIASAKGQKLGDVAGISMLSMFSAGGMARNLPVLKQSQVADFKVAQVENEARQKDMDLASLSPFDTSSKYTFLGSILNNSRLAILSSGQYTGSITSTLPGLMNFSFASMSGMTTKAADFNTNDCDYAEQFGLSTENGADAPAINAAGLPCTGMTNAQMNMSTGEAIDLINGEQWLDENVSITDTDSIEDLVTKKFIKEDTPLFDYISGCSDASTGDYLTNAAGCTVSTANASGTRDDLEVKLNNPRSLEAMSVFLLDYQQTQMINGNDIGGSDAPAVASDTTVDDAALFNDSTNIACAANTVEAGNETGYNKGTPIPVKTCSLPNTTKGGSPGLANSRASGVAYAMFEQMKKDLNLDVITLNDSFRTMAQQQAAYNQYGSGQAAAPGYSNHQMGYAFDINMGAANGGNGNSYRVNVNKSYPGNPVYEWLVANASKYHFKQLPSEGWHWSIDGR